MKRNGSKVLILAIILIMSIGLFACGSDEIVGKWTVTGYKMNGEIKSIEDFGVDIKITMEFLDDGTFKGVMNDETAKGKWKAKDDSKYDVTIDGDTQTMTIEDGKLLMGTKDAGYTVMEKK